MFQEMTVQRDTRGGQVLRYQGWISQANLKSRTEIEKAKDPAALSAETLEAGREAAINNLQEKYAGLFKPDDAGAYGGNLPRCWLNRLLAVGLPKDVVERMKCSFHPVICVETGERFPNCCVAECLVMRRHMDGNEIRQALRSGARAHGFRWRRPNEADPTLKGHPRHCVAILMTNTATGVASRFQSILEASRVLRIAASTLRVASKKSVLCRRPQDGVYFKVERCPAEPVAA